MATYTLKREDLTLTGGSDTVLTVPSGKTINILNLTLTNLTGNNSTVSITAGDSGGEKFWRNSLLIISSGTEEFNGNYSLLSFQVLKMDASIVSGIDATITYIEETP